MKTYILAFGFALAACSIYGRAAAQNSTVRATAQPTLTGTPGDRQSFERTKAASFLGFTDFFALSGRFLSDIDLTIVCPFICPGT